MRTTWKIEWPQWFLLAAMFGMAAWRWPLSPDLIPVHWNMMGQIDRWGGKAEGLLALPLLALGIYALLLVLPRFDPGRANYAHFAKTYATIRFAVLAMLAVIQGAILLSIAGHQVEMWNVVSVAMGSALVVLGSVMGKIRPNWFVGIRTPWTLSSKKSWIQTHRAGGWTFIGLGILQIMHGFVPNALPSLLLMLLVMIASLWLRAYSYMAWRDADDKTPPAGTLPA